MKRNVALTIIVALVILFSGAIAYNCSNFKEKKIEKKIDIHELIFMRNKYQHEYNFIDNEIEAIIVIEDILVDLGEIETPNYEKANVKKIRKQLVKDSIEVLNEMINNYQF